MKILFIRHAAALERSNWLEDDLKRPLSDRGITIAKRVFKQFSKIYPKPEVVLCSNAVRSLETAQIFAQSYGEVEIQKSELLNPGASFEDFKKAVRGSKVEYIAVIGHEPDMSEIIGSIISDSDVSIDIKKSSLTELEVNDNFKGSLRAFIPPKLFS